MTKVMTQSEKVLPSLLRAGLVKRWHVEGLPISQTTAEHSWGVAVILYLSGAPRNVVGWALLHDMPEVSTGDMPGPEKRRNPALGEALKDAEKRWFKERGIVCDLTDEQLAEVEEADRLEAATWLWNAYYLTGSPRIKELWEWCEAESRTRKFEEAL